MSFWEDKVVSPFNMKFPEKLWLIVNECDTGAIGWGPEGDSIALEYEKFQEEYLDMNVGVFKTNNIASFVRQLNLYGFRKNNRFNDDKHEFKHQLFLKGRKDLIQFVKRKPGSAINLNSARTPRRSKVKTSTELAMRQKENVMHDTHIKNEGSISEKETSCVTSKRTPLSSSQNPNIANLMGRFWWNSMPSHPPFYCDRSIAQQGWYPMSSYYNSQTYVKRQTQDERNSFLGEAMNGENQFASNSNLFYLVVPGYQPSQSHGMYSNAGYFGGMFHHPGMPVGFSPDSSRSKDSYSEEVL